MALRSRMMPLGTVLLIGTAFAACLLSAQSVDAVEVGDVKSVGGAGDARREGLRDYLEHRFLSDPRLLELMEMEEDALSRGLPLAEADKLELGRAKHQLSDSIVSFLETGESHAVTGEPYNGLAEPDDKCRNLLDTWMAKCVFG